MSNFFKDKNIRKIQQPTPDLAARRPSRLGKILKLFWAMPVNLVCPQSFLSSNQIVESAPFVYAYKR
jgi:hypothetical protein